MTAAHQGHADAIAVLLAGGANADARRPSGIEARWPPMRPSRRRHPRADGRKSDAGLQDDVIRAPTAAKTISKTGIRRRRVRSQVRLKDGRTALYAAERKACPSILILLCA